MVSNGAPRLYDFQREGAIWLSSRKTGLLADEMGLGKTAQALAAIPGGAPALVVTLACVKPVWKSETKMWRPGLKVEVLSGRKSFRWPTEGELLVVNPEILPSRSGRPARGTALVLDEIHWAKNPEAERTSKIRNLADAVEWSKGTIWGLTGTPLLNHPGELWGILSTIGIARQAFGAWAEYKRMFNAGKDAYGNLVWGLPDPGVRERLDRVMLRRMRKDVLPELPEKTRRDVEVDIGKLTGDELTPVYRALTAVSLKLENLMDCGFEFEHALRILATNAGISLEEISRASKSLATVKAHALIDHVEMHERADEPLVVFSRHRAPIDYLSMRRGWVVVTGDSSLGERISAVESFQAGRAIGFAATIQAGGVGITLTRASNVIFVDLAWTPALNEQAEDRLCRIGQKSAVLVTRLVANHPLDRKLHALLTRKGRLIEKVLG